MHLDLKTILGNNKAYILSQIILNVARLPFSPYQEFILRTEEGKTRLKLWVDLFCEALGGNREHCFSEMQKIGYARAVQGYNLHNIYLIYNFYQKILREIVSKYLKNNDIDVDTISEEILILNDILLKSYAVISGSFLKAREEIISEQFAHLQELHNFTRTIISANGVEIIANHFLNKIKSMFGNENCYLAISKEPKIQDIFCLPKTENVTKIYLMLKKTLAKNERLFINDNNESTSDISKFPLKRTVSIPIQAPGHCYGALALVSRLRNFNFEAKESNLLDQFLSIVTIAIGKAFTVDEIEQKRKECHMLTAKVLTIQEEERKKLAADIHDSIAQSLTGISYRLQVCKEYQKTKPEQLIEQLDKSVEMIHNTMDQSRYLISNLRPDLIDTVGLVPALKRLFDSYIADTGIKINSQLPPKISLPSESSICLFRTVQEALTNVYKHSNANLLEVTLKEKDNNIELIVSDNGKGFEMYPTPPWAKNPNKLGLLLIKERVSLSGGTVVINSDLNMGCKLLINIPLTQG